MALRRTKTKIADAPVDPSRGPSGDDARMTLMEHLAELRNRIVKSLAAVAICGIVGFIIYPEILHWLTTPLRDASAGLAVCKKEACDRLITLSFLDGFVVRMKLASYFGVLFASPFILFQIWKFVTPGLTRKERKWALPFVFSSTLLFAAGTVVAWFTLSQAFSFLIDIGGDSLATKSTADSYITLVGLMFLGFGLSFQFPILLIFLLLLRVITTAQLRQYRRHSIVGIVIFAAVITPSQDPYSLFLMAVPMWIFYEVSIVIGRILKR